MRPVFAEMVLHQFGGGGAYTRKVLGSTVVTKLRAG